MFNEFPYTNFHELNLDWIIAEFKRLENLGVLSVNGQTGEVILYQDARIQLPDVSETEWNIYRGAAGLLSGIEFRPDGAYLISGTQRLKFLTRGDIPESAGVVSVNTKTGIVNLTGEDIPAAEGDPLTISDALDVVNDAVYDAGERVDNTQESIAIISDGSEHPIINAGQYVYIKNNTSIPEGLYTATSTIPANTAITAVMVESVNNGGLNNIKNIIDNLSNNVSSMVPSKLLTLSTNKKYEINFSNNSRALIACIEGYSKDMFIGLFSTSSSGTAVYHSVMTGEDLTVNTEPNKIVFTKPASANPSATYILIFGSQVTIAGVNAQIIPVE